MNYTAGCRLQAPRYTLIFEHVFLVKPVSAKMMEKEDPVNHYDEKCCQNNVLESQNYGLVFQNIDYISHNNDKLSQNNLQIKSLF